MMLDIVSLYIIAVLLFLPVLWFARSTQFFSVTYIAFVVMLLGLGGSLLGQPKPMLNLLEITEGTILHAELVEGEAIYLTMWPKGGSTKPMLYELPWNTEQARSLQRLGEEAEREGEGTYVIIRRGSPHEGGGEEMQFDLAHPEIPQPKLRQE